MKCANIQYANLCVCMCVHLAHVYMCVNYACLVIFHLWKLGKIWSPFHNFVHFLRVVY